MAAVDPKTAKARLHAPGEIACLDVREHGQYGEGHPFLAVPCPFSRLETSVAALVPRRNVPIVLVDHGDGVAPRAALRLGDMGYPRVDWIDGGAPAWRDAGYTLFKGVNVPSKTLGELVAEHWRVPSIGPEVLEAWRRDGRGVHLFDGRPGSEYAKMTIPGSRCIPNGELAHRWSAVVTDDASAVVVNCAGRTRSILGAAGLMLLGASTVYALENGTQGWALSGRTLQHGARPEPLPAPDLQDSRGRADAFARERGIPWITREIAQRLAFDADRTTYLFDVRDPAEHAKTAHPAAPSAPGGQLVQATDQWIGVRHARVILADDTGLRATLAAFWLRELGYEVHVLPDILSWPADWRLGPPDPPKVPELPRLDPVDAADAVALARQGAALLDLRVSLVYRSAHLEGARWTTRARLREHQHDSPVILVGDPEPTALAALDLREAGILDVRRVAGCEREWHQDGVPLVASPREPSDAEAVDYLFFVHDRHDGNLEAAQRYLAWETGLTTQLDQKEREEFRLETMNVSRSP